MVERSFEVSDFHSIRVAGRHDVIVTTGSAAAVRAEGEDAVIDDLNVTASDGVLSIGNRRRGWFGASRRGGSRATVHVSLAELRKAAIAGSGGIHVDAVRGESFEATIAGSGDIAIDEIAVTDARFKIAGSGSMKAAGRAARAGMRIAGSGACDLSGLIAEEADVSVAGSGDVRAHATKAARVRIAGSGDVQIAGGAECEVSKAGSGEVRQA